MAQKDDQLFGNASNYASEMQRLINNKEMSDIKFVIGPSRKAIHAHRCILAARCEVFRAMFAENSPNKSKEGEVPFVLSEMTPEIFLPMLGYLYTNAVSLSNKTAVDVLGLSIEYGLDGLRELCVRFLMDSLSVDTACEAMQAAVTYGQDNLREKAMKYIEQNTQKVFSSKGFHEMSDTALAVVLQSDDLAADELDILTAVREWATVNSVVLSRPLPTVAKKVAIHIRLPLLSPEELAEIEKENEKDKLLNVESVSFAWKCHALRQGAADNPLTTRRKGTKPRESHKGLNNL